MNKLFKKVSGTWVEQTTWSKIWKKISGVWSMLYQRAIYLYTAGVQNVAWTLSTNGAHNTGTFESTSMYLIGQGWTRQSDEEDRSGTQIAYATNAITLTGFSTINIDCENTGNTMSYWNTFTIDLKTVLNGTYLATSTTNGAFARQIKSLNIESLTGQGYLQFQAQGYSDSVESHVRVYNVWLS